MSGADESPVAVVSGAASGIGAAVAAELRGRGWTVAGLDLQPCGDGSPVDGGQVAGYQVDMADPAGVQEAVAAVQDRFGPLDAAVSAAGHYAMAPVAEITRAQWHTMLRVHLGGALNLARAVTPGMVERGRGCFVGITSELAIGGGAQDAHYAAAKGAVIGLLRSLAIELAPHGVRVNGVAPGPTDTPLLAADSPWRAPEYLATLPLTRLVTPQEVAATVRFLLTDGTFVTGEVLSPNAGAVI